MSERIRWKTDIDPSQRTGVNREGRRNRKRKTRKEGKDVGREQWGKGDMKKINIYKL